MPFVTRTGFVGGVFFGLSIALVAATLLVPGGNAVSQEPAENTAAEPARMLVEIYRIAPGRHEAFLRDIASYDEANEMAGLPPRQLFVHSGGAEWDFLLLQPAKTPEGKSAALDAAWDELGLPSGTDFFLTFRENIADHTDTFVYGPTSAQAVLDSAGK